MLPSAQTYYRVGLDLKPRGSRRLDAGDIIRVVRKWVINQHFNNNKNDLLKSSFYTGGHFKDTNNCSTLIYTKICPGNGTITDPDYWSLRYEYQCRDFPYRLWTTDIGVSRIDDNGSYRFILHTYHKIRHYYLGEEPTAPVHTTPSIVRSLITLNSFSAVAGSIELIVNPLVVGIGDGLKLKNMLMDHKRLVPIVIVSSSYDTYKPLINPLYLSHNLMGNANVFYTNSKEVDEELTSLFGNKYICVNGMIRIYLPMLKFDSNDCVRHRYISRKQIIKFGEDKIIDQIRTALTQRGHLWIRKSFHTFVENVEDISDQCRKFRISRLSDSCDNKDMVAFSTRDVSGTIEDSSNLLDNGDVFQQNITTQ